MHSRKEPSFIIPVRTAFSRAGIIHCPFSIGKSTYGNYGLEKFLYGLNKRSTKKLVLLNSLYIFKVFIKNMNHSNHFKNSNA